MQIRRLSPLSFFLPAVLIGSVALAMVAGAPAPASADLEQHTAESFLKRAPPTLSLSTLEGMSREGMSREGMSLESMSLKGMSLEDLEKLLESKKGLHATFLRAIDNTEANMDVSAAFKEWTVNRLRVLAGDVKANIDAISNAIKLKSWGSGLSMGSF